MGPILEALADISVGGINKSDVSEGGPLCWHHVPAYFRFRETVLGVVLGFIFLFLGLSWHVPPELSPTEKSIKNRGSLKALTRLVYAVFAVEIGYKIASRQIVFLFMPCHLITISQIYILTSLCIGEPSIRREYIFRVMLHFLHGPLLAILFPVTSCLRLPYEAEVYWIQHILIFFVVPPYLMKYHFDLSSVPGELSLSWTFLSYGFWMISHWIGLQGISLISGANVGNMLCPASSDPFAGKNYRLIAIGHQLLAIFLMSRLVKFAESCFFNPTSKEKNS